MHTILQNSHRHREEHLRHVRRQQQVREEAVRNKVKVEQEKNNRIKTENNSDES